MALDYHRLTEKGKKINKRVIEKPVNKFFKKVCRKFQYFSKSDLL
jgi:hypothetical protein